MTIRLMRVASWIPKTTNTHSEYVILFAFPMKHWLHERDSVLFIITLSLLLICYVILARILWSRFECRDSCAAYVAYCGPAATGIWRTHVELNALYPTRFIADCGVETENAPSFMVFVYLRPYCRVSNVRMIMNCDLEKMWMEPS
jgi:hypothetical protein